MAPTSPQLDVTVKRVKQLERAKATHLSRQLTMRLQYARLKVDHGWTRQNLNEVENLYFHHYARKQKVKASPPALPPPSAPPRSPTPNDPTPTLSARPESTPPLDNTAMSLLPQPQPALVAPQRPNVSLAVNNSPFTYTPRPPSMLTLGLTALNSNSSPLRRGEQPKAQPSNPNPPLTYDAFFASWSRPGSSGAPRYELGKP